MKLYELIGLGEKNTHSRLWC